MICNFLKILFIVFFFTSSLLIKAQNLKNELNRFNECIQNESYKEYLSADSFGIETNTELLDFFEKRYLSANRFISRSKLYIDSNLVNLGLEEIHYLESLNSLPSASKYWNFEFHSFYLLRNLLTAYNLERDTIYLKYGFELIQNWHSIFTSDIELPRYAWSDHSSANRLLYLILFREISKNILSPKEDLFILSAIKLHTKINAIPSFFRKNHNHGVFQAYSFYVSSKLYKGLFPDKYHELAIQRILTMLNYNFDSLGVHIENSPSYQIAIATKFLEMHKSMKILNDTIPEITLKLERACLYLANIIKPDSNLPLMGDTYNVDITHLLRNKLWFDFDNFKHIKFALTKGKKGEPLSERLFIYENAGYVIITNKWLEPKHNKAFFLMIKSGYLSMGHRHDDDLSFVLWAYGEDWFIDGGMLNYNEKSRERRYLRSTYAHNMPTIYKALSQRRKKGIMPKIISVYESDSNINSKHFSKVFPEYNMFRTYSINKCFKRLSIQDSVISEKDKRNLYLLRYHVPNDKKIKHEKEKQLIIIKGRKYKLILKYENETSVKIINSDLENENGGIRSVYRDEIEPCYTIEISKEEKDFIHYSDIIFKKRFFRVLF